jgi:hypothetical protein
VCARIIIHVRGHSEDIAKEMEMSKPDIQRSYKLAGWSNANTANNEWPEEGFIPEDAYPLQVIHQDDTGYVLLQVDPDDADTLIVACSIDFDYEREGAVAREDIAGEELAPYRKLNLAEFFECESIGGSNE